MTFNPRPDCDCAYVGLPPCSDHYAWVTKYVEGDAAGALPVLAVECFVGAELTTYSVSG